MKAFHPRSFTFAQFHVLVLLLVGSVAAHPTSWQLPDSRTILTPMPRNSNDTHAIEAISAVFSGKRARAPSKIASEEAMNTFSKDCIPPSSIVSPTMTSSIIHTFKLSKTAAASTSAVSFSMFTTSMVQTSMSAPSMVAATSYPTDIAVISQAPASDSGVSTASSGSTSPSSVSSKSSTDPFTSGAQSHLSSLPIFLGAFGGIAGVALLVVGIKVYHPTQHLNEMRRWPSAIVRRLKQPILTRLGVKKWRRMGEYDSEKLTERTSQETDTEYEAQNRRIT